MKTSRVTILKELLLCNEKQKNAMLVKVSCARSYFCLKSICIAEAQWLVHVAVLAGPHWGG